MNADPVWITEAEVVRAMHLGEAIETLERMLIAEAEGRARNMGKTAQHWGQNGNMHAIGGIAESLGLFGTKTWGNVGGFSSPLLILWDSGTARLRAVVEAGAVGQLRTGAMTGLGTRWLSVEGADEMAIVGSGKQASTQAAGIIAVRPIRRVRVFSPTPEKREAFAANLRADHPGIAVETFDNVEAAVRNTPIVTLITRAKQPILRSAMLARGTHINAMGAITEERREFDRDIFPRCSAVAVDHIDAARHLSSEFMDWYDHAEGGLWTEVRRIADVVAARQKRPRDADLTLFKAMGMGLSDLAVGSEILARVRRLGGGHPFPEPRRVPPRLHA
jgi:ornithine cyclodeaminase